MHGHLFNCHLLKFKKKMVTNFGKAYKVSNSSDEIIVFLKFKHKRLILFLKFASNVSHLEELMCYDCRFSLYCNCIRR